jgi:hypothetical protein
MTGEGAGATVEVAIEERRPAVLSPLFDERE